MQSRSSILFKSLQFKLLLVLAPISISLLLFAGGILFYSIQDGSEAHVDQSRNDIAQLLYKASGKQAIERGVGSAMLGGNNSIDGKFQELGIKIDEIAEQTNQLLETYANNKDHSEDLAVAIKEWQSNQNKLKEIRPLVLNRTIASEEWFQIATEAIRSEAKLRTILFSPSSALDKISYYNTVLRPKIATLAEFAGRERALIANRLASSTPLSERDLDVLKGYRSHVNEAIEDIEVLKKRNNIEPELIEAINLFQSRFVLQFGEIRKKVYENSTRAKAYFDRLGEKLTKQQLALNKHLTYVEEDLHRLVQSPILLQALNQSAAIDTNQGKRVATLFEDLIIFRPFYHQVRFIDKNGMERLKVINQETGTEVIPQDKLQNKQNKSYFIKGMEQTLGKSYVSGMDLNMEWGSIEVPFKPVIRYSAAIKMYGEIKGVVVLNVDAAKILDHISDDVYLIDENGFYLDHPNDNKAWGMMPDLDRSQHNFFGEYPQATQTIYKEKKGLTSVGNGKALFQKVTFDENNKERQWTLIYNLDSEVYSLTSSAWIHEATIAINSALNISTVVGDLVSSTAETLESNANRKILWSGLAVVYVLFTLAFLYYIFNGINHKISTMLEGLKNLGRGDLSYRNQSNLQLSQSDELDGIALGIDKMADNLQQYVKDIEFNEERNKAFLDNVGEGVIVIDHEGILEAFNHAAEAIFGYSEEEVLGKNLSMLMDETEANQHGGFLKKANRKQFRTETALNREVTGKRKNGELIPVHVIVRSVEFDGGRRYVGVVIDVTQRNKLDEELRNAKEAAEKATEAKSYFLANMSHEIRTPMNAIIGLSQLALKHEVNEKQRDYLDKINHSATSLLGIVNDILDFSKIEAGKLEIENIPFNLEQMLDYLTSIVNIKVQEKGLALKLDVEPGLHRFYVGDPLRINQILINLVSNAVKFTEQGTVSLKISSILDNNRQGEGKVLLRFAVRDTGVGMSQAHLEKLFTPFTQADASTTRTFGGTGLGLSISKRLADTLGGEISVTSQLGLGSEFVVALPLSISSEEEVRKNGVSLIYNEKKEGQFSHQNVLLVEDNKINQQVATEVLSSMGLVVTVADNGKIACDLMQQKKFDLVFMDLQMPVMDGFTATKAIRKQPQFDHIPIVAMTANAMAGDREKCIAVGMADHVSKPIDIDQLRSVLVKHLPNQQNSTVAPPALSTSNSTDQDRQDAADETLPGLDLTTGLRRLKKPDRYLKLLDYLNSSVENFSADIRQLLEQEDYVEAERLVHSTKGASANISAITLAEYTKDLEIAIREKEFSQIDQLLESLDSAILELRESTEIYRHRVNSK